MDAQRGCPQSSQARDGAADRCAVRWQVRSRRYRGTPGGRGAREIGSWRVTPNGFLEMGPKGWVGFGRIEKLRKGHSRQKQQKQQRLRGKKEQAVKGSSGRLGLGTCEGRAVTSLWLV